MIEQEKNNQIQNENSEYLNGNHKHEQQMTTEGFDKGDSDKQKSYDIIMFQETKSLKSNTISLNSNPSEIQEESQETDENESIDKSTFSSLVLLCLYLAVMPSLQWHTKV